MDTSELISMDQNDNSIFVPWAHKEYFPVVPLLVAPAGRIVMIGGFANSIRMLHLLKPTDYLIVFIFGAEYNQDLHNTKKICQTFGLDISRIWIMCNDLTQKEIASSEGFNAVFCSANCLLDENVYKITGSEKKYDAVFNGRLVPLKRVNLASKVSNLLVIPGHRHEVTTYDSPPEGSVVIDKFLNDTEVSDYLNLCKVGLILSEVEGANLASSEYLLCGLPVVSTPSVGGRDVFFDSYNSIISPPNADDVVKGVQELVHRLDTGEINPHEVRNAQIKRIHEHRKRLYDLLDVIFQKMRYRDSGERFFKEKFYNKILHSHESRFETLQSVLTAVPQPQRHHPGGVIPRH